MIKLKRFDESISQGISCINIIHSISRGGMSKSFSDVRFNECVRNGGPEGTLLRVLSMKEKKILTCRSLNHKAPVSKHNNAL